MDKQQKKNAEKARKKYSPPAFELAFEFNRKSLSCGGGPLMANTEFQGCGLATSE